jgi:hypothetical protein
MEWVRAVMLDELVVARDGGVVMVCLSWGRAMALAEATKMVKKRNESIVVSWQAAAIVA